MKIPKETAQEFAWMSVGGTLDGFTIVEKKLVDHTRWSVVYTIVIEKDGRFYTTSYSKGATESQDESPFEYDGAEIDFKEVKKVDKLVSTWEAIP